MRRPRLLALVPVLALTLTACGSDPEAELRDDVESVTLAANDGDADAVREAVEELLSTIRAQVGSRELPPEEGARLREIAMRIAQNAALLDPEPTPSPTPSPTQEPTPSEEPTPTPEPEPSEEPEPSPEPEPTEEPEESPLIVVSPGVGESPSPSPSAMAPGKGNGKPAKASPSPSPATSAAA